jgi:hypothetical protein
VPRLKAVLPMMFILIVVPTLVLMLHFGFNKMSGLFCKKGIKAVAFENIGAGRGIKHII